MRPSEFLFFQLYGLLHMEIWATAKLKQYIWASNIAYVVQPLQHIAPGQNFHSWKAGTRHFSQRKIDSKFRFLRGAGRRVCFDKKGDDFRALLWAWRTYLWDGRRLRKLHSGLRYAP